jgi:hypothetical protein
MGIELRFWHRRYLLWGHAFAGEVLPNLQILARRVPAKRVH